MGVLDTKIGLLGGGQLGRMLVQSGIDFNLSIAVMDNDPDAPCRPLVNDFTVGNLLDYQNVLDFGRNYDLITIEIEKVNTNALKQLRKEGKIVYPEPECLEIIQDKRKQKLFYSSNGISTPEFILTETQADIASAEFFPAVHKLGRDGYDGRGVRIINTQDDILKGFNKPGVLERYIPFEKELSVVAARGTQGTTMTFPVVEQSMHPEKNLVEFLFSPADIPDDVEKRARLLAKEVITKFNLTGLLAVEMFLLEGGGLLVNEVAPRPHNSGHQTIEGNTTSQFEQHWRSVLGLPLGNTEIVKPSAMINLLGEDGFQGQVLYSGLDEVLRHKDVHLHLYGKKETRPFRKMGHITVLSEKADSLRSKALNIKNTIRIRSL